jgi:hypothetical protein
MSLWAALLPLCAGVGRVFLVALSLAFADSSVRLVLSDPCAGTARKVAGALAVALGLIGAASAAGVCASRSNCSSHSRAPPAQQKQQHAWVQDAHIYADTEAVEPTNRARSRLLDGLAPAPTLPSFVEECVQPAAVSPSADQVSVELFDQTAESLLAPPPLPWHSDVDRLEDSPTVTEDPLPAFPSASDSPLPDESPEAAVVSYNEAIGLVHIVNDANELDEDDENELEELEEMSEEDDIPALVVLHAGEGASDGLGFVSDEELQESKYAEIAESSSESPVPADLAPMLDVEQFVLGEAEADQSGESFDDAMPSGMSLTEQEWDEHKQDDGIESPDQHAREGESLVIDLCHSSPEAPAAHASEAATTRRSKRPRAVSRSLLLKRAMRQHALQMIKACGGNIVPRIRHPPHDTLSDQLDDGKEGAKVAAHASGNSNKRRSSLSSGSSEPSSAKTPKHFIDLRPRLHVLQSMEVRNRKLVERLLHDNDENDEEDDDDENEEDDDVEQKALTSPRSAPVRRTRASMNNNNDDDDDDEEDERPAKRQRRFSLATASSHPYHTRAKDEEHKESSEEDDDSDSNLSGSSNDAEKGGTASNGAALRGIWRLLC